MKYLIASIFLLSVFSVKSFAMIYLVEGQPLSKEGVKPLPRLTAENVVNVVYDSEISSHNRKQVANYISKLLSDPSKKDIVALDLLKELKEHIKKGVYPYEAIIEPTQLVSKIKSSNPEVIALLTDLIDTFELSREKDYLGSFSLYTSNAGVKAALLMIKDIATSKGPYQEAASRALAQSQVVDPEIHQRLARVITNHWKWISKREKKMAKVDTAQKALDEQIRQRTVKEFGKEVDLGEVDQSKLEHFLKIGFVTLNEDEAREQKRINELRKDLPLITKVNKESYQATEVWEILTNIEQVLLKNMADVVSPQIKAKVRGAMSRIQPHYYIANPTCPSAFSKGDNK